MATRDSARSARATVPLMQDRLREVLSYDPATGEWRWLLTLSANATAGSVAGDVKPSGYRLIGIDRCRYRAHRLAWLYMTGAWPPDQVDHIDGNRANNAWTNLRLADNQMNQANKRRHRNNTTGYKGVYFSKQRGRFAAKINPSRKQVHLGFFDDPAEAHRAYAAAATRYYGAFARSA